MRDHGAIVRQLDYDVGEFAAYPLRVAARWSAQGTHDGAGVFGRASGAPIYIMGISHAEIINGKIHREWVLIDELAIHRQIRIHQG